MKKRLTVIQTILLMGLAFALAYNLTTFSEQAKYNDRLANISEKEKEYTKFVEIEDYVAKSFVGDFVKEDLINGAMSGYVEALGDQYSYYLNPEEFDDYKTQLTGEFGGIGVSVIYDESTAGLKILEVYEGSPASKSNIRPFDIVVEVDGISTTDLGYYGSILKLKDEVGSPVTLGILREGEAAVLQITVIRELVKVQTVFADMLTKDIARIRVTEFGSDTSKNFKLEFEKLLQNGATGAVIDLRFNPGGALDALLPMMDILLGEGTIFIQKDKEGNETVSTSDPEMIDIPVVVLINKDSYSAAEYFAAVMQEYGRAYIVGEKTTGKGYAQKSIPLSDGSGLVLSVMKYYTPKGTSLADTGVTPDFKIEMPDKDKMNYRSLTIEEDAQLMKAIDLLG